MSESTGVVRKKKKWGKVYEYTPVYRKATLDEETMAEVKKELKRLRPTTPESFASKYNIKVSVAKKILEDQVAEGKLKKVHKGQLTTIYSS